MPWLDLFFAVVIVARPSSSTVSVKMCLVNQAEFDCQKCDGGHIITDTNCIVRLAAAEASFHKRAAILLAKATRTS